MQVSAFLRRYDNGYIHWCPGCKALHRLPDSWSFNRDLDKPTFSPSFLHTGVKRIFENGRWTGEWIYDKNGDPVPFRCHYFLTNGVLQFCGDCDHDLSSQSIPLPELPADFED